MTFEELEYKLKTLRLLVKQMRDTQKAYFMYRTPKLLGQSKDLERQVDKMLEEK